ncbi:MAG: hypothetical protein NTY77_19835 [Elusimicrobia bacterium]|nr:hypothetical protein [Elusimicrobiota bacterium]
MKKIARLVLSLVAASPILAVRVCAAPTVDWDHVSAIAAISPAGESLAADFKALADKVSSEPKERIIYGVPHTMQDAFSGVAACSILDAKFFRALSIDEAVSSLEPCAQGLSQRYGLPVTAEQGLVGIDGGRKAVTGIIIHVPASIQPGNHILMDLSYSIREQRQGRLLGFPAGVVSGNPDGPRR